VWRAPDRSDEETAAVERRDAIAAELSDDQRGLLRAFGSSLERIAERR